MQRNKLTFNDLPEVVGELCERISSMENLLTEKLHQQHNEVKKDTHVPMTVDIRRHDALPISCLRML